MAPTVQAVLWQKDEELAAAHSRIAELEEDNRRLTDKEKAHDDFFKMLGHRSGELTRKPEPEEWQTHLHVYLS